MTLKIISLQSHDDESSVAFTITFDDLDRGPKLYEALDFLERTIERKWLVNRYRRELRGDRKTDRQKNQLREALRVATRGIQQACVPLLVDKLNELASQFRENKAEINHLRWQLDVVRRPVRL